VEKEQRKRISAEAAGWYARLQRADCTEADRETFETWLAADSRHALAWNRIQQMLQLTDSLPRDDARVARLDDSARIPVAAIAASGAQSRARRQRRWAVPLAASAACLLAALAWFVAARPAATPQLHYFANDTLAGKRQVLEDGSIVLLDVGARVSTAFDANARSLELLAGRALFEVAHDAKRPFSVRAGDSRTVALGTVFQVERMQAAVKITLARGSVQVSATQGEPLWQERLEPGTELTWNAEDGLAPRRTSVDIAQVTGWTSGRHNFRDTPLSAVLEELNRYDERKITLGDARLAELTVGGSFIAGDGRAIAATLEAVLPVRAEDRGGDEIVLLPR
jgi:transmembrane sensor